MSDRELLELAAKAARLTIVRWDEDAPMIYFDKLRKWNPLIDHDQAKTLRHVLRMSPPTIKSVGSRAAYRLAIVRAAAEIGRAMP